MSRTVVPPLPAEAVSRALAAGEWELAAELLDTHDRAVRAALDGQQIDAQAPWLALLSAQRALLQQLQNARQETTESLQRLGRDRRGAKAYLTGGG